METIKVTCLGKDPFLLTDKDMTRFLDILSISQIPGFRRQICQQLKRGPELYFTEKQYQTLLGHLLEYEKTINLVEMAISVCGIVPKGIKHDRCIIEKFKSVT